MVKNPYSFEEAAKLVKKRYGLKFSEMKPTYFPSKDKEVGINFIKPTKKVPSSNECIDFIISNQLFFPNTYGLIIVQHFIKMLTFSSTETWLLGFDYMHHLHFEKNIGHKVAFLKKIVENGKKVICEHGSFDYGLLLEHDERIVAFDSN